MIHIKAKLLSHRLFIASGIFHPESGGPATYLYRILPELQALGWEPRVQAYSDDTPKTQYPYPVTRIPRRFLPIRFGHYALEARRNLAWADLVYAHTVDLPLIGNRDAKRVIKIVGDQAWERCIRKGWIPQTEDIDDFQLKAYETIVEAQKDSRTMQVQQMDGVIVPSEYLKQMVMGWGVEEENIHVIYNAIPRYMGLERTQAEARQELNLPDVPTLFTAARLTAWKGVDHLIEAIRSLPDVRLIVAGDGSMLPDLKEQAEDLGDRVQFLGRVRRDTVEHYMQASDYFALYSGYEGLPHTVLESLRVGTPIIASDKGGNPEVVQDGVNGLLAPYVDVEGLRATIERAFSDGMRDKLAQGTNHNMSRFDMNTMVTQTHDVLSSYLD